MSEITEAEYMALKDKVAKGKSYLAGKWGSADPTIKKWISLWFDISGQVMDYEITHQPYQDPEDKKSQAWKDMEAREKKVRDHREKARLRYWKKKEEQHK
jgi:hypothetical protein